MYKCIPARMNCSYWWTFCVNLKKNCIFVCVFVVSNVLLLECFAYCFSICLILWLPVYFRWIFYFLLCDRSENKILILKCFWTTFSASSGFFFPLHPESPTFLIQMCFICSNIWSYANHQHRLEPDIIFLKVAWGERQKNHEQFSAAGVVTLESAII